MIFSDTLTTFAVFRPVFISPPSFPPLRSCMCALLFPSVAPPGLTPAMISLNFLLSEVTPGYVVRPQDLGSNPTMRETMQFLCLCVGITSCNVIFLFVPSIYLQSWSLLDSQVVFHSVQAPHLLHQSAVTGRLGWFQSSRVNTTVNLAGQVSGVACQSGLLACAKDACGCQRCVWSAW